MFLVSIVFGSLALAEPRLPTAVELEEALRDFNEGARFPLPELNSQQQKVLLDGEVLRVLERATSPEESSRALALLLSDVPRDQVWVSCQDPHFAQNSSVAEAVLHSTDDHRHTWFGLLDLPSPFADRVWVVDVVNNHTLAEQTDSRAWEHSWELNPQAQELALEAVMSGRVPGVELRQLQSAIFTPTNQGAWLILDLPGGYSLFGYHSATELAGNLPTNLVLQFVHAQLGGMLRDIVARGRTEVPGHYDADHVEDVRGGDGLPVPRYR